MTCASSFEPAGPCPRVTNALNRRQFALFVGLASVLMRVGAVRADEPDPTPKTALDAKGFDRALLNPVDGLSFRNYAHIAFDNFAGDEPDLNKVLARHDVTRAQFDHANAAFIDRMRADKTYTLTEVYGAYFLETARGRYAPLAADVAHSVIEGGPLREPPPMVWDQYLELMRFYGANVANAKGTTRATFDEILKPRGLASSTIRSSARGSVGKCASAAPPDEDISFAIAPTASTAISQSFTRPIGRYPAARVPGYAGEINILSKKARRAQGRADYAFSRYPVLNIQATIARHIARNTSVMPRLTATLTSDTP